jgi:hypothetical protein
MLMTLVLLAQISAAATPAASQAPPTPVLGAAFTAVSAKPRTLADVAAERKLVKRPAGSGTLSVAGAAETTYYSPELAARVQRENDKAASAANDEMWRAIKQERWVEENIHSRSNAHLHINAQRDRDSAVENCRKTPGCTPIYRGP